MGGAWVPVREAVAAGTLRASDKGLAEVISRWEQLLRFASLRLGRELGADVQVQLSRKELAEPSLRFAAQTQSLVTTGVLTGTLRIPDAVAPLDIAADLRAGRVTVSVDIDAPREGRAPTRVNWLVRQLKDAPESLRVDAFAAQQRTSTSELLRAVRENPAALIADPKRDLRTFRVAAVSPLGTKRGTGRGGFIDSVLASVDGFYEVVVQQLRPWVAKAPQLPSSGRTATEEAGIDIEPPAHDLLESDPTGVGNAVAPADEVPVEAVVEAVSIIATSSAEADVSADDAADAPDPLVKTGPVEMVSWDLAQDRLDHERSVAVGEE